MNKCNIKVGDYVETWDGDIGYVTAYCLSTEGDIDNSQICYVVTKSKQKNIDGNQKEAMGNVFKRIGTNDFSKKNIKLKPIANYDKNGIVTYTDKLNELIDHINVIQERLNEYGFEKERY